MRQTLLIITVGNEPAIKTVHQRCFDREGEILVSIAHQYEKFIAVPDISSKTPQARSWKRICVSFAFQIPLNTIPPRRIWIHFFFFFAFRPSPGWAESVSLARITTGCTPQGKDSRGRTFFPGWCPSRASDTALSRQSVIPFCHDTFSYLRKDPRCHPGSRNDQEVNKNAIDCEITVAFSLVNCKTRDIFLEWKKISEKKGVFKTW